MKNKELLTVGELAKEMDVTVRTLQYYDKEGLLKPSSKSEGGHRIYTKKDMIKLHQILSLKYLGFSLEEIKEKILSMDKPAEVARILEGQAVMINQQIENLKAALAATEALHKEVLQVEKVDFSKFADIISLLRQNNENYWMLKMFDDKLSDHIRERFTNDPKSGERIFSKYMDVLDRAMKLKKSGELPTSSRSIELAMTGNPDIIFLDEPTAGLDVEGRVVLHEEIRRLKAMGKTIIMASHDMAEVESLCDGLAILKAGEIAFLGTVNELIGKMTKIYRIHVRMERLLANDKIKLCLYKGEEKGYHIFETNKIDDGLLEVLILAKEEGVIVNDIKIENKTLEDSFMDIARGEDE